MMMMFHQRRATIWTFLVGLSMGLPTPSDLSQESQGIVIYTPKLVSEINPSGDSDLNNFVEFKGKLFFLATNESGKEGIWKTDGTAEGTKLIKNIDVLTEFADRPSFVEFNGELYFAGDDGNKDLLDYELWKTDGTVKGTVLVKDINPFDGSFPSLFTEANGELFFYAVDGQGTKGLWKTDGTKAGTILVKRPIPLSFPSDMAVFNGEILFPALDGPNGEELWKTDGTSLGTILVKDINPSGGSFPGQFTPFNGELFFRAGDNVNGEELWKTDGTEEGTILVKDINPLDSSFPGQFTPFNGELLFAARGSSERGDELWKTDGTTEGTVLVKAFNGGSDMIVFTEFFGRLLFGVTDGANEVELWSTDGTEEGTILVQDISGGIDASFPQGFVKSDNGLMFFFATTNGRRRLYSTDGSIVGTRDLLVDDSSFTIIPTSPLVLKSTGELFITGTEPGIGFGLYQVIGQALDESFDSRIQTLKRNGFVTTSKGKGWKRLVTAATKDFLDGRPLDAETSLNTLRDSIQGGLNIFNEMLGDIKGAIKSPKESRIDKLSLYIKVFKTNGLVRKETRRSLKRILETALELQKDGASKSKVKEKLRKVVDKIQIGKDVLASIRKDVDRAIRTLALEQ